jgi:hypothetical protein
MASGISILQKFNAIFAVIADTGFHNLVGTGVELFIRGDFIRKTPFLFG